MHADMKAERKCEEERKLTCPLVVHREPYVIVILCH